MNADYPPSSRKTVFIIDLKKVSEELLNNSRLHSGCTVSCASRKDAEDVAYSRKKRQANS